MNETDEINFINALYLSCENCNGNKSEKFVGEQILEFIGKNLQIKTVINT